MRETWVWSLGQEDPLEKGMATHPSILAWRIPGQRSLVGYSTVSQSMLKLMSIELVILSNHLILCCPLLHLPSISPNIRVFSNELVHWNGSPMCASCGQSIGVSASASVLPINIQFWFPLGLTGLVSLLFKRLWRVFSSTTVQRHQFFGSQPFLWSKSHIHRWLLEKP